MKEVKPKIVKGFRDILPAEMLAREKLISVIKEVYESYGFAPLSTPALEHKETLLGYGEEAEKQIYLFRENDGNEVGLRFDLTVPLARVVAQYREIPRPFKRYQIQPVWRYDKPGPGRFREFLQFDIDIVGTESMMADAEIISAMYDSLVALGLSNFRIRLNNRKVLNTLIRFAGIDPDLAHPVFRVLDKLERQGLEALKQELGPGRIDASGAEIRGLGLTEKQIGKIQEYLQLPQASRAQALGSLESLFQTVSGAEEGIEELREIHDYLSSLEITDEKIGIDLSIARGLDYYTGPVYEATLLDAQEYGGILGGGRFDDLIGLFIGERIPATGCSIGVDRLFSAMQRLGMVEVRPSTADALVTVMVRERLADYQEVAKKLRAAGMKAELYLGEEKSIGSQLKYADRQAIPIAVIIGPDEFSRNQASIKDLRVIKTQDVEIADRRSWLEARLGQRTVPMANLAKEVRSLLGQKG